MRLIVDETEYLPLVISISFPSISLASFDIFVQRNNNQNGYCQAYYIAHFFSFSSFFINNFNIIGYANQPMAHIPNAAITAFFFSIVFTSCEIDVSSSLDMSQQHITTD